MWTVVNISRRSEWGTHKRIVGWMRYKYSPIGKREEAGKKRTFGIYATWLSQSPRVERWSSSGRLRTTTQSKSTRFLIYYIVFPFYFPQCKGTKWNRECASAANVPSKSWMLILIWRILENDFFLSANTQGHHYVQVLCICIHVLKGQRKRERVFYPSRKLFFSIWLLRRVTPCYTAVGILRVIQTL